MSFLEGVYFFKVLYSMLWWRMTQIGNGIVMRIIYCKETMFIDAMKIYENLNN